MMIHSGQVKKKVNLILLVDDNSFDNFYHQRIIEQSERANQVVERQTAAAALNYLKNLPPDPDQEPDLIFIDLNLPGMNGWEFVEAYRGLEGQLRKTAVLVILTSSNNPADIKRAAAQNTPLHFRTKPLTEEMLDEIVEMYW
ncbi:MAG: response regulator [Flavobacteriales bacterium]|nr:response regulator [Flavobacteriales bacterium]